jgi:hypothetical protein
MNRVFITKQVEGQRRRGEGEKGRRASVAEGGRTSLRRSAILAVDNNEREMT